MNSDPEVTAPVSPLKLLLRVLLWSLGIIMAVSGFRLDQPLPMKLLDVFAAAMLVGSFEFRWAFVRRLSRRNLEQRQFGGFLSQTIYWLGMSSIAVSQSIDTPWRFWVSACAGVIAIYTIYGTVRIVRELAKGSN